MPVLICFAFLIGAGSAMNSPAFQAVVSELIPADELPRASVTFNSMGTNLARAHRARDRRIPNCGCRTRRAFLMNGLSFIAVMIVLYRWKREPVPTTLRAELPCWEALRAGVRYALNSPALHTVFVRTAALMIGASALWALLPVIARRELGLGPRGIWLVAGVMGAGSVAAVFILPKVRKRMSADSIAFIATLEAFCCGSGGNWNCSRTAGSYAGEGDRRSCMGQRAFFAEYRSPAIGSAMGPRSRVVVLSPRVVRVDHRRYANRGCIGQPVRYGSCLACISERNGNRLSDQPLLSIGSV